MIKEVVKEDKCCGCGACVTVCPKDSLSIVKDIDGFLSVECDTGTCIECGICEKVCPINHREAYEVASEAYAIASKEDGVLQRSTSGGAFFVLAKNVIAENGIVYGAAWTEDFGVKHIGVENENDLKLLQGSKYIQSDIHEVFSEVKEQLNHQRKVLFSGTPCQVMAIRNFLKGEYDNLLLVDIVCHGVGSHQMLSQDIRYLESRYKGKIIDLSFRSKHKGWGKNGYFDVSTKRHTYNILNSPYYYFFSNGNVFRESCYQCPFASGNRVGDITLGDFWGVETALPNCRIDVQKGVSGVLVNSVKGHTALEKVIGELYMESSSFQEIAERNGQLRTPKEKPANTGKVKEFFRENSFEAVVRYWKKVSVRDRVVFFISALIPEKLKMIIKRIV